MGMEELITDKLSLTPDELILIPVRHVCRVQLQLRVKVCMSDHWCVHVIHAKGAGNHLR